MDINAYIQSGLIESYVLGLTSTEETAEVERLRNQYIEINEAIDEFAAALEKKANEIAVVPPPDLKSRIFEVIQNEGRQKLTVPPSDNYTFKETEGKIKNFRVWRFSAAAAVILFTLSSALNIYLFSKYNDKNEAYQTLLSERETLQANNQVYQTQLKEWQSAAAMIADTSMAMIKMHNPKGREDAATVFWDTRNKDVYVMVNKLPEPKTGKQYQLWAMVDGKPVDAGVLDPTCSSVCKMKNIPKAQAFAITLEKEGGNPTPTLKSLYVIGNI